MFRAYGNQVFVDCTESVPNKTKGGLHLPENTVPHPIATGIVTSVGQGVMTAQGLDKPEVKIGQRITFHRARVTFIDKDNWIGVIRPVDIIGVESDAEIGRMNGKPNLVESAK